MAGFRRLFSVRLLSQFADGVFQVALVSSVLFSPERAPNAGAIAAGFATILLPFSVLGPFVGVFLDRWPRRMTLVISNLVRAVVLVLVAVLVGTTTSGCRSSSWSWPPSRSTGSCWPASPPPSRTSSTATCW